MALGFTGKILRVNFTTGSVATEDSTKYQSYLGGTGIGERIMFDEVPVGTKPYDEANKVVIAIGPSTGSSAPCSGRTTLTSLSTFTKGNCTVNAHVGGEIGTMMKAAGYDAIILEGKAAAPVYLKIDDADVTIEDASGLWGKNTRETSVELLKKHGQGFTVTSIGVAGENMVNQSCVINAGNHSAGAGQGAIWGSKNLKAIAMHGTGATTIADPAEVRRLNDYVMKELMGSNNNHAVPSTERPWAEYSSSSSRWTGRPGLTWGAAEGGPVDTGDSPPGEINKFGYRCQKSSFDFGEFAEKYTVKITGCTSCPVRCCGTVHMPELEKEGYTAAVANTCVPNSQWKKLLPTFKDYVDEGDGSFYCAVATMGVADELGLWDNYGELPKTINYFITNGLLEQILPADEYNSLLWDKREAGDVAFTVDIMRRIANKQGVLATLGEGAYFVNERYKDLLGDDYMNSASMVTWNVMGSAKHHGNESAAQVGALVNLFFNRDCMTHTVINFDRCGLPYDLQKEIIEEQFGEGCYDKPKAYTPINDSKVKFAKFGVVRQTVHDSVTFCNWVWPMTVSPVKERNYRGDLTVEAQYMTAVTGDAWTMESLDEAAERILHLQRAQQVMWLGTVDMRNEHDKMMDWIFDADPDIPVFTEGTVKMDRDDMQTALSMMYTAMGWDETTGAPTRATLEKFDLADVADRMESMGLLVG